ncbi:hypothetical protein, partial [Bacillus sp. WP8]|uniref:hypothetical protein n=1 Tax=Bacillus sp. WP8 TaxID=756828 RepID=UPI001C92F5AF
YIVKHNHTPKSKTLPIKHFQDHIPFNKPLLNPINKQFPSIQEHLQEISNTTTRLTSSLLNQFAYLPNITEDINKQLKLPLSLSNNQIKKIKLQIQHKHQYKHN